MGVIDERIDPGERVLRGAPRRRNLFEERHSCAGARQMQPDGCSAMDAPTIPAADYTHPEP
jgi:hypothetical protein